MHLDQVAAGIEPGDEVVILVSEGPEPQSMPNEIGQDGQPSLLVDLDLTYGSLALYFGLEPHMTCLGKVVGGGMPLAVYGGKQLRQA